jgi:hypothetical protein
VNGSAPEQRHTHLRVVRDDREEPPHPDWWGAFMVALNVAAIAFVAWVGYERSGWRGALFLVVVGVAVSYGYRHAAMAAGRVAARRGRKPPE